VNTRRDTPILPARGGDQIEPSSPPALKPMGALTQKQAELLEFIGWHQRTKGTTPSFQEMCDMLGLHSKSGIHRLIGALEERGYIRRIPNRARCIEILPEHSLPTQALIAAVPTRELALEARRRGLVLGEYHRSSLRVGDKTKPLREFVELRA
jgi:DNA-binding MarR family transcriptional regulator